MKCCIYFFVLLLMLANGYGEVFTVDTNQDVEEEDGKLSLREAVAASNANGEDDVIVFSVSNIKLDSVITINDAGNTLRIEGKVTLDGQKITQIFQVVDTDIELDTIKFKNASVAGDGGAINADVDSSVLSINECDFIKCTATGDGGGAFFDSAVNGRFSNLTFTNCTAGGNGGGLSVGDFDDSDNLVFKNCSADGNGGGVNIDDDGEDFTNCTFTNCTSGGDGGAINSENDLDNFFGCKFTNCSAEGSGGAMHSDDDVDNIMNCTFTRCTSGVDGGAVDADANLGEIYSSKFTTCSAEGSGGAISVAEDSEIWSGCQFTNCSAGGDGGAILAEDGIALITKSTFNNCSADGNGGTISLETVNVDTNISSTEIKNGECGGSGGAIVTSSGTLVMTAVTFNNNDSGDNEQENNNGGAISADTGSNVSMEECVFKNHIAFFNGGAIFTDGTLIIIDTTFEKNKTKTNNGGAIFYSSNSNVTAIRSTFENNSAENQGGATYSNVGANGSFTNCTFSKNKADDDGGAHFADNPASDEFIDCTITRNKSGDEGGGIYAQDDQGTSEIVNINSTIIDNNTAKTAGNDLFDLEASGGAFDDGGFNLIEDNGGQSEFIDGVNSNIVGVDGDLESNAKDNGGVVETHALKTGSAAIDTGDDGNNVDEDSRQFDLNSSNDIGAFESDAGEVIALKQKDSDFCARMTENGVELQWSNVLNKNIRGFHIWRKDISKKKSYKVTPLFITSTEGISDSKYSFVDIGVRDTKKYYYALECITSSDQKLIAISLVFGKNPETDEK
ncbi:right-handed parallel beta-helix repeat-containing protein [Candidatus Uabimicrobium sp. HlEnr_7]|uniref:right-handed parallel beta-helix repeat-containing protein n=1 Tax=Candidatus Uabimicrobium helgolandensis TaxID=3095367 RepID=UPI003556F26F